VVYIADFRIRRIRTGRPKGFSRKVWKKQAHTPKLFIEIDGGYHATQRGYDRARTRWIESHRDAVVIRFTNEDIYNRPLDVMKEIELYNPARKTKNISYTSTQHKTKAIYNRGV
jgi:very-short-patch-repair endonuclease